MNFNADMAINVVIALLPIIPMGFIVQQLKSHRKAIEDKLIPINQQAHVEAVVREVVMAVEQTCNSLIGPQKKFEALRLATQLLNEKGIHVSQAMLETLVESSVLAMKAGRNPTQTQVVQALTAAGNAVMNPSQPAQ